MRYYYLSRRLGLLIIIYYDGLSIYCFSKSKTSRIIISNMRPGTLLRWHALKNILKKLTKHNLIVLDIGGFDGSISSKINNVDNSKIVVVDLDHSGLQQAKQMGLNCLYASALELPISNERIDLILCLDLIEHVDNGDELISEIARTLKRGGVFVLTTPMANGVSFPFLNRCETQRINKKWGHLRSGYELEELQRMFKKNGLKVNIVSRYFNFLSRFIYRFTILRKQTPIGSFFYKNIIKLEPFVKIGSEVHIIVGEKSYE